MCGSEVDDGEARLRKERGAPQDHGCQILRRCAWRMRRGRTGTLYVSGASLEHGYLTSN